MSHSALSSPSAVSQHFRSLFANKSDAEIRQAKSDVSAGQFSELIATPGTRCLVISSLNSLLVQRHTALV